jgi:guanylate kinase
MNNAPPVSSPRNPAAPLLIVISAPSGGGKTTLCHQLLAKHAEMSRAVTCTTRPPRPGEKEGVDYYFLDAPAFARRAEAGDLLEFATVYNHQYGTPKTEVLARLRLGWDVLLNIDVQGAASIAAAASQDAELSGALVTVFLTPATVAELDTRLRKRGTDAEEVVQRRLGLARQEIAQRARFQYLIISTTIEEDLRRMEAIIEAERMRQFRAIPVV